MKQYAIQGGTLTILDGFPKEVRTFKDFPTGVVSSTAQLLEQRKLTELFYQIDLVAPRDRKEVTKAEVVFSVIEKLKEHAATLNDGADTLKFNSIRIDEQIEWLINPAAVKKTFGTPSVIHASSSTGEGFTNFELYFPRGLFFRMMGNWGPESKKVLPPDGECFTGSVVFANRPYHFRLRPRKGNDWNLHTTTGDSDANRRAWVKNHVTMPMSKEDAAAEMRRYIELYFPFIKEYNMLGEFVFD